MILTCPSCAETIPAEEADVSTGLVRCLPCNEAFRVADLLGPSEAMNLPPARVERPSAALSELAVIGERLTLLLPRGSNRGAGFFFLFFSAFWNAITWTIALGALLGAGIAPGEMEVEAGTEPVATAMDLAGIAVFIFLIPFLLIGLGTAVAALYLFFGRTALIVDREQVVFVRSLFGREWVRRRPTSDCVGVDQRLAYSRNDQPVHGVGIVFGGNRALVLGSGLPEREREWLRSEIDQHLRTLGVLPIAR
ncbi:MAG TPA: hypothetical protein VEL07_20050 [Planctomycetota bacterium]|nr:hypothetical protein [Planctomycetota bacterium]